MYTPQLPDNLVQKLYLESKVKKRPMTKLLNDIVNSYFIGNNIFKSCTKCGAEIETDLSQDTAYCEHCESEVFVN